MSIIKVAQRGGEFVVLEDEDQAYGPTGGALRFPTRGAAVAAAINYKESNQ